MEQKNWIPLDGRYIPLVMATLNFIEKELERVYWNKHQESINSPFSNTGNNVSTENIQIRAYNWEQNDKPNFETDNIQVWWYKHSNRGVSATILSERTDYAELITEVLNNSLDSIAQVYNEDE